MERLVKSLKVSLVFLVGLILGFGSAIYLRPSLRNFYIEMQGFGRQFNVQNREVVPCESIQKKSQRLMVALVLGQSNAANHGESRYLPTGNIFNYFEGQCYKAQDPLLGATATQGSVWTRLGDQLVNASYDSVIFVPIAIGSTTVSQWTPQGNIAPIIQNTIQKFNASGLPITHVFWHQGESDAQNSTPKDVYKKNFLSLVEQLRDLGVKAPIYVSIASRCNANPPSLEIQQAQRELINENLQILRGPNTDELDHKFRFDGCHFSNEGLEKIASKWIKLIEYPQEEAH